MHSPDPIRSFTYNNVTLAYRMDGHGPHPLVCIHGVGSSMDAWEQVVDVLAPNFTILSFDLRGHGRSSKIAGRYEIDDMVAEILALIGHVGFQRFNLVGFSLGGLLAQRLTLLHEDRVDRLLLLSTVAGRNEQERKRVMDRLAALQQGDAGSHFDSSLSRWLTERFQRENPNIVATLREKNAQNDRECYAAAYRVLAECDFGEQLHNIECPTLIATGEEDSGSNPRMASFMHQRIAGSRLHIFPKLRHSILNEAPKDVALIISDFISRGDCTSATVPSTSISERASS